MDEALRHLQANDPILNRLIATYPRPPFRAHTHYFQALVDSIISQQLSVKAARAIETRFKGLFDGSFPTPMQLCAYDSESLRAVGLSQPKARYILDLAQKVREGEVDFTAIEHLSNNDVTTMLTRVTGIGEWTAHMFMMFCLGRLDVLPVGDLGVRNAVARSYTVPATAAAVTAVAEQNNWRPYETVASWYMWQSLDAAPITSSESNEVPVLSNA